VIKDQNAEDYSEIINNIGESLLPEQYQGTSSVTFLPDIDYDKIKLKEKKALLMDQHQHILQTPWDIKLTFEEEIIKKALNISNEEEQILLLQDQIATFIREVEFSIKVLENTKEIYDEDLIEKMAKELMIPKVNHYRIRLIKEFIERRISPAIAKKIKNKVEEFLGFL
jgi:hypothetical protein